MNKKLNSGLALILPNKKVNLFVIFIVILGIISGSLFLMVLNDNDKSEVINEISTFMTNINTNNINNLNSFKNSLIEGMILIILSWILGMSIIGVIFNIFFIYMKSFTIGFSISSFILVYKYKGILSSLVYTIPSQLINILIILILGVYTLLFSKYLFKMIFLKDKTVNLGKFFKKYVLVFGICIILCVISALCEAYLLPSLLKVMIKLFI
ncbi:MAG: stage II sporulation protein M [Bacilli bacterium]|nr:stage II sporulation protein M [Clostridium sp.]MDY2804371.1 stage II sporulation protein M [Bacilli bacterium]